MTSILVVCTGNVCRSPLAEAFLRAALERRMGDDAPTVASAGTAGWDGSGAMAETIEAARERGIDITTHVARRLAVDDLHGADLIVAMAADHRDAVAAWTPDLADRIFTLKELVRLLESLPPVETASDLPARVRAAAERRREGFRGNPFDEDVVDPMGMPLDNYRAVAWELDEWTDRLAEALAGPVPAHARQEGA
jgi:protein-tyrosine phosphatase